MQVIAATGLQVPREDNARRYITDEEPMDVPEDSIYYQRRLLDGDLLLVEAAPAPVKTTRANAD